MDKLEAIGQLRPGSAWIQQITGRIIQVEDGTPRVSMPTDVEIQAVLDSVSYGAKRAAEYPPIPDQLDAMWTGGTALTDMAAKIAAIKAKYPKPSASASVKV